MAHFLTLSLLLFLPSLPLTPDKLLRGHRHRRPGSGGRGGAFPHGHLQPDLGGRGLLADLLGIGSTRKDTEFGLPGGPHQGAG